MASVVDLRNPKFLREKLGNCLTWISTWNDRWQVEENSKPEFMNKLTTRVVELSKDKEQIHAYTNEVFLEGVSSQGWIRQFLLMLHKFYKLNGPERITEVDKLLADGRALITEATKVLEFAEQNKELLREELFKAGAYTEILFWPYLYQEQK